MNKKYMDFVPKSATKIVKKQPAKAELRGLPKAEPKLAPKKIASTEVVRNKMPEKRAPKAPVMPAFVNTEKVRKRPLSKNVYPKKVVVPKEEKPTAPVTIIDKPEKDSKVGLIVTVIITIILGAAAGTVAFLLLPK